MATLTQQTLRLALDYDAATGIFTNRVRRARAAPGAQAPSANKAGILGVCFRKNRKAAPWWAQIQCGGRRVWSGYFATADEAHAAYRAKKMELFDFLVG